MKIMNEDFQNIEDRHESGSTTKNILMIVAIVIALFIGLVWYLVSGPGVEPNVSNKVGGAMGVITSLDQSEQRLNLKRSTIRKVNGENVTNERNYNIIWDENTNFFTYEQIQDVKDGDYVPTSPNTLGIYKSIIVRSNQTASTLNESITASEIHILPGGATRQ